MNKDDQTFYCNIYLTAITFVLLFAAYIGEYFYKILPCELCQWQRYLLWAALGLALIALLCNTTKARLHLIMSICLLYFINTAIAIYQVLIEQGIVPVPKFCQKSTINAISFVNFQTSLMGTGIHNSCDQFTWNFVGISLAGYAIIFYVCITAYSFIIIRKNY